MRTIHSNKLYPRNTDFTNSFFFDFFYKRVYQLDVEYPNIVIMAGKYDVFVGNLTFNTTEEQLREKFSFVGPVKHVRILTDKESGKPKGFAFVEYFDSNTALSAIRHLDQTELNSRKIKVGYPAQSNLKDVARQIGQVHDSSADLLLNNISSSNRVAANVNMLPASSRQQIEKSAVNALRLHEAWDVLDAMKRLVAEDNNRGHKARAVLESHPQLIHALYEIQRKLGIPLPRHAQLSAFGAVEPTADVNRNGSSMLNQDAASANSNSSSLDPAHMASSRFGRNQQDFYVTAGNAQNDYSYNQSTNAQSNYLYHQSQAEYPFQSGNIQTDFPYQSSGNNQMEFPYQQSTDFPYQQSGNNQTDFIFQTDNNPTDFLYQQQSVNNQTDFPYQQSGNNQTEYPFQSANDYSFQSSGHQNNGDNYGAQGQFSLGQFGAPPQQAQLAAGDRLEMGNYASGTYDAMQGMQFQTIAAPGVDASSASMPSLQPYTSFDAPMSAAGHQSYGPPQGSSERRSRFGGKAVPVGALDEYNSLNMQQQQQQQQQFNMQQGAHNARDGAQHHRL